MMCNILCGIVKLPFLFLYYGHRKRIISIIFILNILNSTFVNSLRRLNNIVY